MRLLEREALIGALRAEQVRAEDRHGRVVLITGEAGSGKSALARAAASPSAVWGYCEPLTTPRPLGPFRDIAAALWSRPPARATALSVADRLLERMQQPGPAVVIEDAQWIDSASADALRFLGRRIAASYGLLTVISRDERAEASVLLPVVGELVSAGTLTRLEVPPLTPAAVAELTRDAGIDIAEAMRLTGGNALLVTQLAAGPDGRPAADLQAAIAARLARLAPSPRRLVIALSVLPGRIPGAVLSEDEWDDVDQLVAVDLLKMVDGEVEFRHELVRLAVDASLTPGRRRALHEDALRRLNRAGNADPARLAHHARHAELPAVALSAETAAARRAAALGSHREAAAHYRRAAQDARLHAPPAEHINLLLSLALQENGIGRDEQARAAAEQALQESIALRDPAVHARAARVMSRLELREERAHQLARVAVDLSESTGDGVAARAAAYANLANNRMLARDLLQATAHAQRALAIAETVNDIESEIIAAHALGTVQLLHGDPAGEAMVRRAIHLAAAHGDEPEVARCYANLVSAAGEARSYALSARAAREALSYFTARDLDGGATYVRAWTARCLFEQGRWTDAEQELAALDEHGEQLNAITRLVVYYISGRLNARRGTADPAPSLRQAETLATTMGALQRVAPVLAAQAEAHWLGGRPVDIGRLTQAYQLALTRSASGMVGELGFWLWRLGELDKLDETASPPFLLHSRGGLHAAADAWLALGCPYEAGDALGDSDAEADLRRALDIFGELGAVPQWQRAAQRLRALGVRSLPRRTGVGSGRNPDRLTAREAEVLEWLAQGHSDAQIAHRLHLSVRTVEHHVAAILRKKGVTTRRDLRPGLDR